MVLRNAGPVGGPGMPEWGHLPIPAKLLQAGRHRPACASRDARMSGTSYGAVVLHVAPESAVGGPLALVEDGDPIRLDVAERTPRPRRRRGGARGAPRRLGAAAAHGRARATGKLHADHVLQANEGCDFDFLRGRSAVVAGRGDVPLSMKVLVTGAHGKVGRALVPALAGGRLRRARDRPTPSRPGTGSTPGEPEDYWQADLTDAGAAYAVARGCDVVVHTAAIPQPIHNPPHVVFGNNMLSTFNVLEAAIAAGVAAAS